VSAASLHGAAFLLGETGILVTGASGSGKTSFVLKVAALWRDDPVRLVADDRVRLAAAGGRLVARPVEGFLGGLEIRGLGMAQAPAMPSAVMRLIVALQPDHPPRMPHQDFESFEVSGVFLPLVRLRQGDESALAFITKWPYFRAHITGV
jgi:HPr kinase/phosphorylase